MNVAVIATNAGGIPEIVSDGESDQLYVPGDVAQRIDTIIRLHCDPTLRRLVAADRAWAVRTFFKRKHYDRLKKIMQGLTACTARR